MTKEELPKKLQPWWDHRFSSGSVTGEDYQKFEATYGRWLRKALAGYEVDMHRNHYEFSAVVTRKGKDGNPDRYVYLSISDVRFFPRRWALNVLARTMEHAKDWVGGRNTYCTVNEIPERVARLMEEQV